MQEGRDHWWHRLMEDAPLECTPEPMDAEDLLYILYTSGTTGKPKGIVHTTGGYLTQCLATTKVIFDLKDEDVFFCTSDLGWAVGHSYIAYAPLLAGARSVSRSRRAARAALIGMEAERAVVAGGGPMKEIIEKLDPLVLGFTHSEDTPGANVTARRLCSAYRSNLVIV
jgi:acyl-coenzyme A synthetase/AMP-(fatty) acid ligase